MPTIKRKVEMNLPQLIEWGLKNEITSKEYTCNNKDGYKSVIFSTTGTVHLNSFQTYLADDKYKVEVEEPITEDTVFDKLISRYVFLSSKPSYAHAINASIKEVIEDRKVATHIYLENEENELQLIWTKEKGLVE